MDRHKRYRTENPEKRRQSVQAWRVKNRAEIAGRPMPAACEVCGVEQEKPLHLDHEHGHCNGAYGCKTCARGWLCSGCNLALGHVKDNPETLIALAAYLIQHEESKCL